MRRALALQYFVVFQNIGDCTDLIFTGRNNYERGPRIDRVFQRRVENDAALGRLDFVAFGAVFFLSQLVLIGPFIAWSRRHSGAQASPAPVTP